MALNLTGLPIDNYLLSQVDAPIGTYRDTDLDVATFNQENLGQWLLCDGGSCVGSAYQAATGKSTVPDFLTEGTFRRQAKTGRSLGTYEDDTMQGHKHSYNSGSSYGGYSPGRISNEAPTGRGTESTAIYGPSNDGANGEPRTGPETRPKNHACNVFIKIGH